MKLIFLYGPPAVGKLTVAQELEKLTGFKIFHNHLTIDLVKSIFSRASAEREKFINKYRLELIEAAAKTDVNLIFTMVYAKEADDPFVKKIINRVKKHGGEVCFVQLLCEEGELKKRIKNASRKKFSKMKKIASLKDVMEKHDLVSGMPFENNFIVNNTKLSPRKTAIAIVNYFKIK
ncbi:MAG: hypothetical protein COU11_01880 [Candidatus Harrisonbacteria bacterium CG10_big_fil_rev_8_21_14_0_10_49_15]|uniref:Shikimate kinase n=1 Tax=Candidatus Harrisonbacteria bacterium CG10_big_fil_rev_8_21_14_0_10_49_15 TaxID=1974587 RepID=A0A2H0UNA6_9BACT|nr:MAG: hypothetical protein COU11_01880 [Candidatus Harrisonbacteria bacterium CG10_big_fil_rev_8_21_14_0_10_49_15]